MLSCRFEGAFNPEHCSPGQNHDWEIRCLIIALLDIWTCYTEPPYSAPKVVSKAQTFKYSGPLATLRRFLESKTS